MGIRVTISLRNEVSNWCNESAWHLNTRSYCKFIRYTRIQTKCNIDECMFQACPNNETLFVFYRFFRLIQTKAAAKWILPLAVTDMTEELFAGFEVYSSSESESGFLRRSSPARSMSEDRNDMSIASSSAGGGPIAPRSSGLYRISY